MIPLSLKSQISDFPEYKVNDDSVHGRIVIVLDQNWKEKRAILHHIFKEQSEKYLFNIQTYATYYLT